MPLVSQLNRNAPTVQIASVLPSTVSSSTNNQCSSSGLGIQILVDSSNVRNAQGVNLHSHSVLIPPSISSSQDLSIDRILPKTQIPIPGRDSQVPVVISNAQHPSAIQVIENGVSSAVMVSINDSANPNDTTVAFDLGNAREIGMEDMKNGRDMPLLGQTIFSDKITDIGAFAADELITEPVPQDMNNVCDIVNAVVRDIGFHKGDTVTVDVGTLDNSPMAFDCGIQDGDGTDIVDIRLEDPILPDHEGNKVTIEENLAPLSNDMNDLNLVEHGLSDSLILVESDSQTLVQMVKGLAAIPWKLQDLLKRIKLLFGMMNLQISHIYRETNGLADFLASFTVHSKTCTEFSGSNVLPVAGRLIQQQDQTEESCQTDPEYPSEFANPFYFTLMKLHNAEVLEFSSYHPALFYASFWIDKEECISFSFIAEVLRMELPYIASAAGLLFGAVISWMKEGWQIVGLQDGTSSLVLYLHFFLLKAWNGFWQFLMLVRKRMPTRKRRLYIGTMLQN
ncbi:unnamed protein product [Ilex paraguariensis]|uniref:RNase H type-1 domain-containing protein n=1 Tax=Ilex paraguariensis TaxID=185542 RepID=A0ABC8SZ92_9AQUA